MLRSDTTEGHRILGVDPGTRVTGWGMVEITRGGPRHVAHGCVRTDAKKPLWDRLETIHAAIAQVASEHQPKALALERCFVSKNAATALKLGHARGVIMIAAMAVQAEVFEYGPSEIKSAVVGHGRADKTQVAEMVRLILGLTKAAPQDASDALAAALCHVQGAGMRRRLAMAGSRR